jgi:hypothetical protein
MSNETDQSDVPPADISDWDIQEPDNGGSSHSPSSVSDKLGMNGWQIKDPDIKEKSARGIGIGLLVIFGLTLFVIFLVFSILALSNCTDHAERLIKSFLQTLEAAAKFSSAVFTPLLAFVLGYYFGTGKSSGEE